MKASGSTDRLRFALRSSACFVFLILAGLVAYRNKPAMPPQVADIPIPPLTQSPWLNVDLSVKKVGSNRCAECHPEESEVYHETSHGRSMARADLASEPPDAEFVHSRSDRRYRVHRNDGRVWHQEWFDPENIELGDYPLHYVIGSGHFSKSYLVEQSGFLVESPVTWYASRDSWGMSPGYDEPAHMSFRRAVSEECLLCHVGHFETVEASPQRFRFHELAIGCERCHGAGALHVSRHASGRDFKPNQTDRTIVNPRRLSRDLAEAICQDCHLNSDAQVPARGRALREFRPGLPLEDFRHEYRLESSDSAMTVVGHVEQLHLSRCYQESEILTCITCHHPHAGNGTSSRSSHRDTCLKCHSAVACGVSATERTRQAPDDDCTVCHMPQVSTDIPHIALTHHRIGVHRGTGSPPRKAKPTGEDLRPVGDLSKLSQPERTRSLSLAYHQLYKRNSQDPASHKYRDRAQELLTEALSTGLSDPAVNASLALIAVETGQFDSAQRHATSVLSDSGASSRDRVDALTVLSQLAVYSGNWTEGVRLFSALTQLRRNPQDWFLLAQCRQKKGDWEAAISALEEATRIDPGQGATHQMLIPLYERVGNKDRRDVHLDRARRLPLHGFRHGLR